MIEKKISDISEKASKASGIEIINLYEKSN